MRDLSIRKTQELSPVAKQVLEALLGRNLRDDEEVTIWASSPHDAPTGRPRKEAWDELNRHLDLMASKAEGVPADELESLADDVCDESSSRAPVRNSPRYKPVGSRGDYATWIGSKAIMLYRRKRRAHPDSFLLHPQRSGGCPAPSSNPDALASFHGGHPKLLPVPVDGRAGGSGATDRACYQRSQRSTGR